MAQNASTILQDAFKTTSSKLLELETQHHKLEQYTRRECLDFSGIPNSVAPKDLENFILRLLQEILTNRGLLFVMGWERQIEQLSSSWLESMLKMCIWIRRNWKMLTFLAFFPMMISKIEMTRPQGAQGVKTVGWREVCPEKGKILYRRISTLTTDICIV